jgi:hypothetical protein
MLRPDFKTNCRARQAAAVWATGHTVALLSTPDHPVASDFRAYIITARDNVLADPGKWPADLTPALKLLKW